MRWSVRIKSFGLILTLGSWPAPWVCRFPKNNSLWASKHGTQGTSNQPLATRVGVGFLGSLGLAVVSTLRLPNFPERASGAE